MTEISVESIREAILEALPQDVAQLRKCVPADVPVLREYRKLIGFLH